MQVSLTGGFSCKNDRSNFFFFFSFYSYLPFIFVVGGEGCMLVGAITSIFLEILKHGRSVKHVQEVCRMQEW